MKILALSIFISFYICCLNAKASKIGKILTIKDTSESYQYNKARILDSFCVVLNDLKKHYHYNYNQFLKFSLQDEKPRGFFVYDLTDTLNNSIAAVVKFEEGHIYHFAPIRLYYSYSNICVLEKGKLVFFKALNCKKNINSIDEAVSYLKRHLPDNVESRKLLERTRNYRHYGKYIKTDYAVCGCEW